MRKQQNDVTYVTIKNNKDENPKPRFYIEDVDYSSISGELVSIGTERKEITPTTGENAGKRITIHNLLLGIVDHDGEMQVQVSLYSSLARNAINALAGPDELGEVFLSVYKNKNGFRCMSVKKSEGKEDWYTPFYDRETEAGMLETKTEKGEEKKDYDKLTDKYVKELIPIIIEKIEKRDATKPSSEVADDLSNDDLPF